MGLMSFFKEAGEKLFGKGEAKAAQAAAAAAPSPETVAALSAAAGKAIGDYLATQGLPVGSLDITFDAPSSTVTVSGTVDDQATKEKVLLCCGNVHGVAAVNDMLVVSAPAPVLRRRQQVPADLRGQQADAVAPGQDLSGADAAHPAGLSDAAGRAQRSPVPACSAFIAPAPIDAPKRLTSRSATFSLGV
jgi:nucleoid-associated protein YgaU